MIDVRDYVQYEASELLESGEGAQLKQAVLDDVREALTQFPLVCAQLCVNHGNITVFGYGEELAVVVMSHGQNRVVLTSGLRVITISPGVQGGDDGRVWPPLWSGEGRPAGYKSVSVESLFPDDVETEIVRQLCLKFGLPYRLIGTPVKERFRRSRGKCLRGPGRRVVSPEVAKAAESERNRIRCAIEDRNWPRPVKDGVWEIVYEGLRPREAAATNGACPKRLSNCARTIQKVLAATPI